MSRNPVAEKEEAQVMTAIGMSTRKSPGQSVRAVAPEIVQSKPNLHRNEGIPLRLEWVESARVNLSAVERRAATLTTRRSVKKEWQAAWLVKAITCMDLTTLAGDDTPARVERLCAKAKNPIRRDLVESLGLDFPPTVGAVCVYPTLVAPAVKALQGSGIPVASVATGFPAGLMPLPLRLEEIRWAVGEGAREIDIVITRAHVLGGNWKALYDEVRQMRRPAARRI
jgi:deoxyribose-phosphate aldolase